MPVEQTFSRARMRLQVLKMSFPTRSEAGRYAANQRWKGHLKRGGNAEHVREKGFAEGIGVVSRNKDGEWVDKDGTILAPRVTREMRIANEMRRRAEAEAKKPLFDAAEVTQRTVDGLGSDIPPRRFAEVLTLMADRTDDPDITNISLAGTGLMSRDNLGIARKDMPQVPSNRKTEFLGILESRGVTVEREEVLASTLKPIQAEISGRTAGQIMRRIETSTDKFLNDFDKGAIVVSSDGYVIDGHHRWAAYVGLEFARSPLKIRILRVNMRHRALIDATKKWNNAVGIEGLALGANSPSDPVIKMGLLFKAIDIEVASIRALV